MTYGALLELAVVAGLLDAVKQLLDESRILGLGPGSRLVLGHFEVGSINRMDDVVFRDGSCRRSSLRVLAPGLLWLSLGMQFARRQKRNQETGGKKRYNICPLQTLGGHLRQK